jgi:Lrp/AsnC family transcriptional regulator
MKLDSTDIELLRILQENAATPLTELAAAVNLSSTPCWRRIQRLKEAGIIIKQVNLVDPKKVNVGVTVFVSIKSSQHSEKWFSTFNKTIEAIPEVVEFYRMSGDVDYLLRVVVPDIAAYDQVYKKLIKDTQLLDVSSSFAMEQIKFTTALPLRYVNN